MSIRIAILASALIGVSVTALSQTDIQPADLSKDMQSWAESVAQRGKGEGSEAMKAWGDSVADRAKGEGADEGREAAKAARARPLDTTPATNAPLADSKGINLDEMLARYKLDKKTVDEGLTKDPAFYVFVSFSQDPEYLKRLFLDVSKAGGQLVIRGFVNGSQLDTIKAMAAVQGVDLAALTEDGPKPHIDGMILDPTAFQRFGITQVPTFVVAEKTPPCLDTDCSDIPPPFDKLSGQVSVEYALRTLAEQGTEAKAIARAALRKLGGQA